MGKTISYKQQGNVVTIGVGDWVWWLDPGKLVDPDCHFATVQKIGNKYATVYRQDHKVCKVDIALLRKARNQNLKHDEVKQ